MQQISASGAVYSAHHCGVQLRTTSPISSRTEPVRCRASYSILALIFKAMFRKSEPFARVLIDTKIFSGHSKSLPLNLSLAFVSERADYLKHVLCHSGSISGDSHARKALH